MMMAFYSNPKRLPYLIGASLLLLAGGLVMALA
jgi:hypothetical protein